jgi:hypothetical protein
MTEAERDEMMRELELRQGDLWIEIYSELQADGAELPIWVLVASQKTIGAAVETIVAVTHPYRSRSDETDFSINVDEFRNGKLFHWNHVEPYELRSGQLVFPLGAEAIEGSLADSVYETIRASRKSQEPTP